MNLFRKVVGNKRVLIGAIIFLFFISAVQGIFIVKLYRSANLDKPEKNFTNEFEKYFSLKDDFFKPFDNKPWDPFNEFKSMRERMDRMFEDSNNRFTKNPDFNKSDRKNTNLPQIDLSDESDRYVVKMNIPGSEKTEIEADIEGNRLNVKAKIQTEKNKSDKYLKMERSTGVFQRSIQLPGPVESDAMKTLYKDGVLTITLPKKR
jgi:HSP20 family protein